MAGQRDTHPVSHPPSPAAPAHAGGHGPVAQAAGNAAVGRIAQSSFQGAGLFGTATSGANLFHNEHAAVTLLPGTHLSAYVSDDGIYFQAHPGVNVVTAGPTIHVTSVRYDFSSARFIAHADDVAHVNLGIVAFDGLGLWRDFVTNKLDDAIGHALRPLLPPVMARPGYSIHGDPHVEQTIAQFRQTIDHIAHPHHAPSNGAHPGGVQHVGFRDVEATAMIAVPNDLRIPIAHGFEAKLPAGTRIDLDARTVGAPPNAVLNELSLSLAQPGLEVSATGHSLGAALATLNLRGVKITRGGHFEWQYDTGPENLLSALVLGADLIGAASDPRRLGTLQTPNVHVSVLHAKIDALLTRQVSSHILDLLHQHPNALAGISLAPLLGPART